MIARCLRFPALSLLRAWMGRIIGTGTESVDSRITQLLHQLRTGDRAAGDELLPLVYDELHRIAKNHLSKERPSHTLQPTALVHEAYLKLFSNSNPQFSDRVHFLALVSRVMRRILVDYARSRGAERRGGKEQRVPWHPNIDVEDEGVLQQSELLELDFAIDALAKEKESFAELIEMRYFGGMTAEEIAEALGRSVHMVRQEIRLAQAWLRRELAKPVGSHPSSSDGA
jgi:RNA polymerase sigma-70 factor (ECF subfamily)